MTELLISVIALGALIMTVFIPKYRQYRDQSCLYTHVSWCVSKDSSIYRCNLPLYSYVFNAQNDLQIPAEYRLSIANDKDVLLELLQLFQNELANDYFAGRLKCIKSKYVIPGNHYFMFALNSFLEEHQCDSDLNGHSMQNKTLHYNQHGSWGVPLYDASYEISEFAVIYHKLFYITYLFCKESKIINSDGTAFQHSESIRKILDTKQIEISRM